jgi:hypothetical protein
VLGLVGSRHHQIRQLIDHHDRGRRLLLRELALWHRYPGVASRAGDNDVPFHERSSAEHWDAQTSLHFPVADH